MLHSRVIETVNTTTKSVSEKMNRIRLVIEHVIHCDVTHDHHAKRRARLNVFYLNRNLKQSISVKGIVPLHP